MNFKIKMKKLIDAIDMFESRERELDYVEQEWYEELYQELQILRKIIQKKYK